MTDLEVALVELDRVVKERDAYKRAKAENDERFQIERDELRAELERVRKQAAFYFDCLSSFVELVCGYEFSEMFNMSGGKTCIRILQGQKPTFRDKETMPGVCLQKEGRENVQTRGARETCQTASSAEVKKQEPIFGVRSKVSESPSREGENGLPEKRSIPGKVQNYASECSAVRENNKAEDVLNVQLGGNYSCSSQRLQQAVQRGVAMQYLSREEAQEILITLQPDAGFDLVRRSELESAQKRESAMRDVCCELVRAVENAEAEIVEHELLSKLRHAAIADNAGSDYIHRDQVKPLVKALQMCVDSGSYLSAFKGVDHAKSLGL